MASEACSIDEALEIARQQGFAEPDPSADVSGRDAAEKLCVLADAIGVDVAPDFVQRSGLESITLDDLRQARQWGFEIKCIAALDDGGAFAGPVLLPRGHQLCQVRGADNALLIDTERSGEIVLRGRGAGPDPSAAAIIGDVISVLRNEQREMLPVPAARRTSSGPARNRSSYFVRVAVERPLQPAHIIAAFRGQGIEIAQIECRPKTCAALTRAADRDSITSAVASLCNGKLRRAFIAPVRFTEIPEEAELEIELTDEEFELAISNAEAA